MKIDAQIEAARSPSRRTTKSPPTPSVTKPPAKKTETRAKEDQAEMGFSEADHNGTTDSAAREVVPQPSKAEAYQQFLPPDDFTLVQPLGVRAPPERVPSHPEERRKSGDRKKRSSDDAVPGCIGLSYCGR